MNFKNYIYSLEKKPSILFEQIRTRSNIFLHLYHFTILLYEKLINLISFYSFIPISPHRLTTSLLFRFNRFTTSSRHHKLRSNFHLTHGIICQKQVVKILDCRREGIIYRVSETKQMENEYLTVFHCRINPWLDKEEKRSSKLFVRKNKFPTSTFIDSFPFVFSAPQNQTLNFLPQYIVRTPCSFEHLLRHPMVLTRIPQTGRTQLLLLSPMSSLSPISSRLKLVPR